MVDNSQFPLSRILLERLSNDELIKLADNYGIDIPYGLERIFIIEELLEYSNTSGGEVNDDLNIDSSLPETAMLPKQYNISYIEIIIRDPLWVFAFWEIKGHDRELHENANDFKGYCLRVIPLKEDETEPKSAENSFTIPVDINDSARYFGFAEHSSKVQGRYIIKLGVIRGDMELHIASSKPFCLPRLIENDDVKIMNETPLVNLSGIQDLAIIKSTDRQSRIKRQ
jgi:hypothetical protein